MDVSPSAPVELTRMMPRVVQRRKKPTSAHAMPSISSSPSTSSKPSSSNLLATDDNDIVMDSAAIAFNNLILDPEAVKESERLEVLLFALETCLSDWSLSVHKSTGLLQKMRDSPDGCACYITTRSELSVLTQAIDRRSFTVLSLTSEN